MSASAYNWHKWLGSPLPFYDDPATQAWPGGGLAAPKQDTGWSAPATQVPYTAPSTTGGGDWTRGGFTPRMEDGPGSAFTTGAGTWDLPGWAYGGNQKGGGTYNAQTGQWDNGAPLAAGSDVYGAKLPVGYDSAQDRGGLEYNGQNVETFWSRMLRFAKDSGLPPEQAMQQALDRIRRDNGGTLQGTGFQEGGGTGTGGANTGGNTVDPDNGTGLPIPGGTTPTTPVPMGPLNSIGGQKLANSPELAWRYLVQQMGGDADYEGPFSNYMQSNYAPALAAMINARLTGAGRVPGATGAAGQVGMDQVGNYIGEFGGLLGGNDLFTRLAGIGSQGLAAGGGLLNQASSQEAGNFVRQMLGLTGMGNAPLAQSAQQYLTNKMINDYTMSSISSRTGESPLGKFGTYLGSNGFLDKLRQFGLLR